MITPYVTTNDDVRFAMMQRAAELLTPMFECSVAVLANGLPGMHNAPILMEPGDVCTAILACAYMNLCTDAQDTCCAPANPVAGRAATRWPLLPTACKTSCAPA